jgi:hypothetical protein
MLECTHTPFNALRTTAQNRQAVVGRQLAEEHSHDKDMQHFVQQLYHASLTAVPQCLPYLAKNVVYAHAATNTRATNELCHDNETERCTYIDIANKSTAPFLVAYSAMIKINICLKRKTRTMKRKHYHFIHYNYVSSDTHTDLLKTNPFHPKCSADMIERISGD